jgi:hypothetical protein
MVCSAVASAQRPVLDGVATMAAIASPLPVQAALRWDVMADPIAAIPEE